MMTERLGPADADALVAIYEEALPASERKPAAAIAAYLGRDDYHVLGARADGRLLGFAILCAPETQPVALLEYMAIDRDCRGSGLGGVLFNAGLRAIAGRYLLIEVDSDRAALDARDAARRRKQFYRRLGCAELVGLDYKMPPLNAQPPPAMDLLIHRNGGEGPMAKSELAAWLEALFALVYARPAARHGIAEMLAPLSDPVEVA